MAVLDLERVRVEIPPLINTGDGGEGTGLVAVVGAGGRTGRLYYETLSQVADVRPVFHGGISGMFKEGSPKIIILATPNPAGKALTEIAEAVKNSQRSFTLILPQNGVDVVSTAQTVLAGSGGRINLVRASLFTKVTKKGGEIDYNPAKNRIAFSPVPRGEQPSKEEEEDLYVVESLFSEAGFQVKTIDDYRSMEWTKLVANLVGSTSTITGLAPLETFSDPDLYALELRGIRDRFQALDRAKIKTADLWGIGKLRWLSRLGWIGRGQNPISDRFRGYIAKAFAAERNNQPSEAAKEIAKGEREIEPTDYYHRPFTRLAEKFGVEDPADWAIWDVLKRHQDGEGEDGFDLNLLTPAEKRSFLLETYGLETEPVFVKKASFLGVPYARLALERIYEWYTDHFQVLGKENLQEVNEVLGNGKSVLVLPNHRSHGDHPSVIKALRENLQGQARKSPVYVVAGMKFDKEEISGRYSAAYAHPVVWTLEAEDSQEKKWKAQIVNRRAHKLIERLLEKPSIFVVYLEGGRNKSDQLVQPPALHSSSWLFNSRFELAVPTVIWGTEKLLPAGSQKPQHADVVVGFLPGLKTVNMRTKLRAIRKRDGDCDYDKHFSGPILDLIESRLLNLGLDQVTILSK